MRLARLLPILLTLAVASCASPESSDDAGGTGGSSSEGGNSGSTGGTIGTGGSATGGSTGTGGKVATGGATGTGGTSATGGTTGTGGTVSTGGTTGTGGTVATGGATGTGGAGKGGTTGTGGTPATGGTTGKAGASGTGGTPGTGGTGGAASSAICKFASGLNVAWVNFANDIPNPNLTTFNTIFTNSASVGGRVIRWWFHTNGTVTPGYDSSGKAMALTTGAMNDLVSLANAAHAAGVALNISLWSFDMLQGSGSGENIPTATLTNNQNLLTIDDNRNAYINNVLIKLVTALKGNPGVYSYEIFNEPEGMSAEYGWTDSSSNKGLSVPEAMIQRTVNWFASAIHTTDPSARVTNGSQTFDYCSTASGKNNLYSDTALRNAGGMQNGTLDFYEVHYYAENGTSDSPFLNPASHWGLDKNLVMGEFWAVTTDGVNGADLYTTLYSTGYNGAWAWNYETNDDNGGNPMTAWPTMKTPMQNLYTAQMATLNACP
jgi:hypothetical protein